MHSLMQTLIDKKEGLANKSFAKPNDLLNLMF